VAPAVTFASALFRAPAKPYSPAMVRALAELQDRSFAAAPEGIVSHVNDWDCRVANRAFFLVAGTHRYLDGRRATTHCTTFQNKADALTFAQRWRLNCPGDDIRVLTCDVEWRAFEPTTKTDRAALERVQATAPDVP
jgi:hypothetical protein